ncbi:MAG: ATP-binding protein [Mycobacteriales bacterium]
MNQTPANASGPPSRPDGAPDGTTVAVLLLEQAPTFLAFVRGDAHRIAYANRRFLDLIGAPLGIGLPLAQAWPDPIGQGLVAWLDGVLDGAPRLSFAGARCRLPSGPEGAIEERVFDFVCQPIADAPEGDPGIVLVGTDITERAASEQALRGSEASFRAALKAGRMGSWETDHAKQTRTWSQEGMELFGIQLPEGRGQVGGPEDEYVRAMHPDDRHWVPRFYELADRQDSFPAEYRIVHPDGSVRWLLGRGLVTERNALGQASRLVSIMADVTERRLSEERLRTERERLSLALASGQMGAYELNARDNVLWWSPETYALFEVDPHEFVPTPANVSALIHPDDRQPFIEARSAALAARRPVAVEFRTASPGAERWLALRGQAEYDDGGAVNRSFGIVMDISDRKRAEKMLREADRRKDEFIAVLAHELRNPLAPVRNATSILQRVAAPEPTVTWCLEVIDRQIGQMARLLDDLLDVSRLTQGQFRLRRAPMELRAAIEHAVETAQPHIGAARHRLRLDLGDEPLPLAGDLTRLAQVFSNLLINAAKYTPAGGEITLSARRHDGAARVRVVDNGVGIEPQHQARIFELFGQVGVPPDGADKGQGIGLALVKGLVEQHGGRIGVESQGLGRGSQFEVTLPIDGEAPTSSPVAVHRPSAGAPKVPCRVLVADDLRDIADSVALLLQDEGHAVQVAYDGVRALQLAESWRPDVVLLDIGMPGLDGHAVCRRIRAAPWGAAMLLIAQTGWGQESDRRQTDAAGFDHHLVKPLVFDALIELLTARCGRNPTET